MHKLQLKEKVHLSRELGDEQSKYFRRCEEAHVFYRVGNIESLSNCVDVCRLIKKITVLFFNGSQFCGKVSCL